ncbi:MAG: molybdopterin-dependent oxidoreductase [Chloroflexi bacterium]|nr:molybdopterin-dependent oxidoreductase [Chloroflexota bacterium]
MNGIAQGIGAAFLEEYVHENGQLATSTFMDYLLPTAHDVPQVRVHHHETPSAYTEYGVKGDGEGGRMVADGARQCRGGRPQAARRPGVRAADEAGSSPGSGRRTGSG